MCARRLSAFLALPSSRLPVPPDTSHYSIPAKIYPATQRLANREERVPPTPVPDTHTEKDVRIDATGCLDVPALNPEKWGAGGKPLEGRPDRNKDPKLTPRRRHASVIARQTPVVAGYASTTGVTGMACTMGTAAWRRSTSMAPSSWCRASPLCPPPSA